MEDWDKIESTFVSEDEFEDSAKNKTNKDKMYRRFFLTYNNPFWENQFEEIDIENTELKLNLDKYDLERLKDEENSQYFEFKYIKYKNRHTQEDEVVERPFFKDVNSIKDYIVNLTNFKYSAFQIEKGGNSELTHIQGMIIFKNPVHWSTFCRLFPLADFSPIRGSNTQARQYCTKEETRIDGYYELGEFTEERSRTDIREFMSLIDAGGTDTDLMTLFPSLYVQNMKKISDLRSVKKYDLCRRSYRDVEVTFIYGSGGLGKSTYVDNLYGFEDTFFVDTYDNSAFTYYSTQDVLVLDEFAGQFSIQTMNKFLDRRPLQLRGLGSLKWACYTKVYIISNLSLSQLYKTEQESSPEVYKAFLRRIHNIIHFTGYNQYHFEKRKDSGVQQALFEELDENLIDGIF